MIGIVALVALFGMIGGIVFWYTNKKKQIHAAQQHWASGVARLGGREMPQAGPGGTRTFEINGALLSVVNFVFLENNIAKLVTPSAAPNSWQSQLTAPCQRPTPAFKLLAVAASNPTGDPDFDARWAIVPILGASQADVMNLLTPDTRRALNALPPNTYQIVSGGQQICAFREDMVASEGEVEALATGCALLAGQTPNVTPQAVPGHALPVTESVMGGGVASRNNDKWTWHYSKLIGIMYGPIPVGIIVVVVGAAVYFGIR